MTTVVGRHHFLLALNQPVLKFKVLLERGGQLMLQMHLVLQKEQKRNGRFLNAVRSSEGVTANLLLAIAAVGNVATPDRQQVLLETKT